MSPELVLVQLKFKGSKKEADANEFSIFRISYF